MVAALSSLGKACSTLGFTLKKYAPQIMVIGGIVGGAGATVLACIATSKSAEVINEAKEELDTIQKNLEDPEREKYTEVEAKADKKKVHLRTAGRLAKNYAPAAVVGAASVVSILGGTGILNKRNAALASSLAVSVGEFEDYRRRLIEKFGEDGEEIDKELRYGTKKVEVKEKVTDDDGKQKVVKKKINVVDDDQKFDGYVRMFDPSNPYWDKDPTYCDVFLNSKQAMFNDRLKAYGYVFLNDVLEELGFPRTRTGQEVGWIHDPSNPNIDNYIDFGITPVEIVRKDGDGQYTYIKDGSRNSGWLLEFNVDGSILNKANFPDKKEVK